MSSDNDDHRPMPGPGTESAARTANRADDSAADGRPADSSSGGGSGEPAVDVSDIDANPTNEDDADDEQDRIDRDKIDFDPDDGLYAGTAVDGTSDIPGPHEQGEDVMDDRPQKGDDETSENDPDGAGGDSDAGAAAGDAAAREAVPSEAEQKQAEQQEHANQAQDQDRTSH